MAPGASTAECGCMPRIAIFAEAPDWHCRGLAEACTRKGASVSFVSLRDCAFAVGRIGNAIAIPGFVEQMPDAVIVRVIPTGTFEQVTFRLSILHALSALGVPVFNSARAIERCVDKSMTSFLLHRAGIPTPPTYVTEQREAAESWARERGRDIVLKPLFGAQGRGLMRLPSSESLPIAEETFAGVYYAQEYVGREMEWRDYRVLVIGDRPVAAMRRWGKSWITNVCRGAACEAVPCDGALGAYARAAAQAVGAEYCGVDLIEDDAGALQVLEVNSMPAWVGLQNVTPFDIAERIATHVLSKL